MTVDLNSDVGEIPAHIADGTQESLLPFLTSVNIACGGHAGDLATMQTTVDQARRLAVAIGAHPGYPDRANFGRVPLDMPTSALADSICNQIEALLALTPITHVKPHGALYNSAARDAALAQVIAEAVNRCGLSHVVLVGLANSTMLELFREAGFRTASEAFADRRYAPDGTLLARSHPDALIGDPAQAAEHALRLVEALRPDTLCIHGDTPGAVRIAEAVRNRLEAAGIAVRKL